MNIQLLLLFIGLNIVNVMLQTVKNIVTIKCGKWVAAIVNAITFGLYTIVTIYMLCDLPLFVKAGVVAGANLIGVFVVKLIEEKSRKDKLWKIEATVNAEHTRDIEYKLADISHSCVRISPKHTLFNFYCATQEESRKVREIAKKYNAKFFVSESKAL